MRVVALVFLATTTEKHPDMLLRPDEINPRVGRAADCVHRDPIKAAVRTTLLRKCQRSDKCDTSLSHTEQLMQSTQAATTPAVLTECAIIAYQLGLKEPWAKFYDAALMKLANIIASGTSTKPGATK